MGRNGRPLKKLNDKQALWGIFSETFREREIMGFQPIQIDMYIINLLLRFIDNDCVGLKFNNRMLVMLKWLQMWYFYQWYEGYS